MKQCKYCGYCVVKPAAGNTYCSIKRLTYPNNPEKFFIEENNYCDDCKYYTEKVISADLR